MASVAAAASHARPTKVLFDKEASHEKRRELFLEWQQRRRDEVLDKIRQLENGDGCSDNESDSKYDFLEVMQSRKRRHEQLEELDEDEAEGLSLSGGISYGSTDYANTNVLPAVPGVSGVQESGEMEVHAQAGDGEMKKKRKKRKKKKKSELPEDEDKPKREAPIKLMSSEWLAEKPEDFEENWAGVLCPVGKRCLIISSRRTTKVFSRKGEYYGHFQSMLPSGNSMCCRAGNRTRGVTMLDCIWSDTSQVFYVLDLICWNSHSCINCDMDYRQFFLTSKFAENPDLPLRNRHNRVPLILLPYFRALDFCNGLAKTLYPIFPEPVDGILFYHREGFYIPEASPLCLWILLNQVHKRLGVDLPIELRSRQQAPSRHQPPRFKAE